MGINICTVWTWSQYFFDPGGNSLTELFVKILGPISDDKNMKYIMRKCIYIYIYIVLYYFQMKSNSPSGFICQTTCCSNPYIANLHLHKSLEWANSGLFWDPRWANTIHGLFWDLPTCYSWCLFLLRHIGGEQNPTENGKWRNSQGSLTKYWLSNEYWKVKDKGVPSFWMKKFIFDWHQKTWPKFSKKRLQT